MIEERRDKKQIIEIYHDHFENSKQYNIPRAQLIIADIPYNLGEKAYASSPQWYVDGDNSNGESKLAHKSFFDTDNDFNIKNFFDFACRLLKPEPKERGKAPCMIVFCSFEQLSHIIELAKNYGFNNHTPIFFIKDYSGEVLKANMRVVGAMEYAVVLFREKLPKFNNGGKMVFNWFKWLPDVGIPKLHPTQKPINNLKQLIEIYTDRGDVVIDPVAGSGTTLRAAAELGRSCYGFEIKKKFYNDAKNIMLSNLQTTLLLDFDTEINEDFLAQQTTIFDEATL